MLMYHVILGPVKAILFLFGVLMAYVQIYWHYCNIIQEISMSFRRILHLHSQFKVTLNKRTCIR